MTYIKPLPIMDEPEGTDFEINFGPHEDAYRVTVTSEAGSWLVDFNELGCIDFVAIKGFDEAPTWEQASQAISMALTTYLMQHNT